MPEEGGEARGQNLEHLPKVLCLCGSFLEVYICATDYQKAFIVRPNLILPYPTLPYPTLPYPTLPYPTLPYPTPPNPTPPHPTPPHPTLPYPTLPYPTPNLTLTLTLTLTLNLPYPSQILPVPNPTPPHPSLPYPLRIRTYAHIQDSRSRTTLSCNSSYKFKAPLRSVLRATENKLI